MTILASFVDRVTSSSYSDVVNSDYEILREDGGGCVWRYRCGCAEHHPPYLALTLIGNGTTKSRTRKDTHFVLLRCFQGLVFQLVFSFGSPRAMNVAVLWLVRH